MGPVQVNFIFLLFLALNAASPLLSQAALYTGSTACRTCHPNVALQFFRNPHNKSIVSPKVSIENAGCEGCHGPGKKHVDARGGKQSIVAFSELTASQVVDACLRCHSKDTNRANIRRSNHAQAGVGCTSCHSIHQPESNRTLLAKRQAEVCYGCHNDVRAQFALPFKHRVNEGFMTCSDCHNPHGDTVRPGKWAGGRTWLTPVSKMSSRA